MLDIVASSRGTNARRNAVVACQAPFRAIFEGMKVTPEQPIAHALRQRRLAQDPGAAGTGKTTTLRYLVHKPAPRYEALHQLRRKDRR